MASDIIPKKYQRLVTIIFYLCTAVMGLGLAFVTVGAILAVTHIIPLWEGLRLTDMVVLLCVSAALMSLLVFFGMLLGVFQSNEKFQSMVMKSFFVALFGALVSLVAGAVTPEKPSETTPAGVARGEQAGKGS